MSKDNLIAGLDIGSERVSCVIAREDPDHKIRIISGASRPCPKGIKNGIVVNISEVTNTIASVFEEAEDGVKGESPSEIYVGVRGNHISSMNNNGIFNITRTDKSINPEDVANVIENAKAIHIPQGREIMHVIPRSFSVDKEKGFPNPVGMDGGILEVNVHIVTGSSSHLNNISKAISNSGISYNEQVYHLFPLAEMVLSEEEKNLGSILIDIGGQTSSVAIYNEGKICFSEEILLGSYHITKDIATALNIPMDVAQDLKEKYGCALSKYLETKEPVSVVGIGRMTKKQVSPESLLEYVQPRLEQLLIYIKERVEKSGYAEYAIGSVITGGGSLLKGMPEAVKKVLQVKDARYGFPDPEQVIFEDEEFSHQRYNSAVALVYYPFFVRSELGDGSYQRKNGIFVKQVFSWVKDLFR